MAKFIENVRSNGLSKGEATEVAAKLPIGTMIGISALTAATWHVTGVIVNKTVDAFGTKDEDGKPIVIATDKDTFETRSVPTAEKGIMRGKQMVKEGEKLIDRCKDLKKKAKDEKAEEKKDKDKS